MCDSKHLNILDSLHLPACYKGSHLLNPATFLEWIQLTKCVSLNVIVVTPMPYIASSDDLPWTPEDDVPFFIDVNNIDKVPFLCINTSKLTSDELVDYAELPQAIPSS